MHVECSCEEEQTLTVALTGYGVRPVSTQVFIALAPYNSGRLQGHKVKVLEFF